MRAGIRYIDTGGNVLVLKQHLEDCYTRCKYQLICASIRALVRCNVPLLREVPFRDSKDFHSGYREGE